LEETVIFKQLFDQNSWTYTYLLADPFSRQAVIIDPVVSNVERDLKLIAELGLELTYTLDTHVHADHITGSGALREQTGAVCGVSAVANVACADRNLVHGDILSFGAYSLEVRSTPGHTSGCLTFVVEADGQTMAFTGDALFIRGCGRTDFQEGDAATLYQSVHGQIFSLPEDTVVYPGHDYRGHTSTTVREEQEYNPRLNTDINQNRFIEIMTGLNLSNPKMMDVAIPANLSCGRPVAADREAPGIQLVAPEQVVDINHYRVIDVREPQEYNGLLGHIDGAELVPLATVPAAAAEWSKEDPVLVVCRSGGRAATACELLQNMGFSEVANLDGGMLAWNKASEAPSVGV
jgi:sulfur dioxygenase